jgi:predicted nucleic acid-binding protein
MECVLDCSLALAWVLPDEGSARAERLLTQVSSESILLVPALWWYEVSNALTVAQRRHRLADADRKQVMALYAALPIRTDVDLGLDTAWRLQTLAHQLSLSAYDAAYLELAQRNGVGLATLDRRLTISARKAGVSVLTV